MQQNGKFNSRKKQLDGYIKFSAIGFQMAAMILIGTWAGHKVDGWLGMKIPVFTLVLSLFAVTASIIYLIRATGKKDN